MKKFVLTLFLSLLFAGQAVAQKQLVIEHDYSHFRDILSNDFFDIVLIQSPFCSVKIITDVTMEDYVQAYVKDDSIILHLDTKGMPSDVKKAFFSAWNGKPRITAEISAPVIRKVVLDGNSSLCSFKEYNSTEVMEFHLSKTASIPNLTFKAKSVLLSLSNKSEAVLNIEADSVVIDAVNNSTAELQVKSDRLSVNAAGFCKVEIWGTAQRMKLETEGRSKILFNDDYDGTGTGQSL